MRQGLIVPDCACTYGVSCANRLADYAYAFDFVLTIPDLQTLPVTIRTFLSITRLMTGALLLLRCAMVLMNLTCHLQTPASHTALALW